MLTNFNPDSLNGKSLQQLNKIRTAYSQQKAELEKRKNDDVDWSEELQELLDSTVLYLVDIDDAIEPLLSTKRTFHVPKGQEDLIHLIIHHGDSFSPKTGESIAVKRQQVFSYSEWTAFKESFKRLGYTIDEVLHDPFGEVANYVK